MHASLWCGTMNSSHAAGSARTLPISAPALVPAQTTCGCIILLNTPSDNNYAMLSACTHAISAIMFTTQTRALHANRMEQPAAICALVRAIQQAAKATCCAVFVQQARSPAALASPRITTNTNLVLSTRGLGNEAPSIHANPVCCA